MTSIFWNVIGHMPMLTIFLSTLISLAFKNKLYLKWKKCELYAKHIEYIGQTINAQGIHPDVTKLNRIQEWYIPRTYNDIQQFIGLVNYINNSLPDISNLLMARMQNRLLFQ